jgi:hypothetical protein
MNATLKNLVKNTTAEFVCYRDGDLWYRIVRTDEVTKAEEASTFEFPVPISDTGTGIFPAQVKAITLMRWIRKQLEKIQKGEWG